MEGTKRIFVLLVWLYGFSASAAPGFQVAEDAAPVNNPQKFILYWGKHQCDISEINQYSGNVDISAENFRQMIVTPPSLWTGKELIRNMSFKLEGFKVSTENYASQLATLDQHISAYAKPGATLRLTDLTLAEGVKGVITFTFSPSTQPDIPLVGRAPNARSFYLNTNYMDRVVWGREDIYENPDRDFFSVGEFWQTIRQEPVVEWNAAKKPLPLLVDIQLVSKDKVNFSVIEPFEEGNYSRTLKNLDNYRHMVHPGGIVTLQLETAGQYDRMYQKTMFIVADNDPRLRLRRKRDQHRLSIKWGPWAETIEELYLFRYTDANGESKVADPPIARNVSIAFADENDLQWGHTAPECSIDDQIIGSDLSFRVSLGDSLHMYIQSGSYDPEATEKFFKQVKVERILIDSVQLEGYDLPSVQLATNIVKPPEGGLLLIRNNLETLQQMAGNTTRIKLQAPVPGGANDLVFLFDMPEKSKAIFSIFESTGASVMSQNDEFPAGETRLKVPRSTFRKKGQHYAFLNTIYGVVKVTFNVD